MVAVLHEFGPCREIGVGRFPDDLNKFGWVLRNRQHLHGLVVIQNAQELLEAYRLPGLNVEPPENLVEEFPTQIVEFKFLKYDFFEQIEIDKIWILLAVVFVLVEVLVLFRFFKSIFLWSDFFQIVLRDQILWVAFAPRELLP